MDLNSSSEKITQINNCNIIYFIYFIVLITIIYLIYKFIYYKNNTHNTTLINEHFNNIQSTNNLIKSNVCPEITSIIGQEQKFNNIKEKINNRIKEHDNALYISTYFDKINPGSINVNKYFDSNYPLTDLANKKIITNQIELNQLVNQTNNFKNIYKPGDIVESPSSFDIDKNKICDLDNNKQYSNCMVCSVEKSDKPNKPYDWTNSKTKTNIKNVCLFSNKPGPGINSIDDCKKLCNTY
jgi:hypothetical protein